MLFKCTRLHKIDVSSIQRFCMQPAHSPVLKVRSKVIICFVYFSYKYYLTQTHNSFYNASYKNRMAFIYQNTRSCKAHLNPKIYIYIYIYIYAHANRMQKTEINVNFKFSGELYSQCVCIVLKNCFWYYWKLRAEQNLCCHAMVMYFKLRLLHNTIKAAAWNEQQRPIMQGYKDPRNLDMRT